MHPFQNYRILPKSILNMKYRFWRCPASWCRTTSQNAYIPNVLHRASYTAGTHMCTHTGIWWRKKQSQHKLRQRENIKLCFREWFLKVTFQLSPWDFSVILHFSIDTGVSELNETKGQGQEERQLPNKSKLLEMCQVNSIRVRKSKESKSVNGKKRGNHTTAESNTSRLLYIITNPHYFKYHPILQAKAFTNRDQRRQIYPILNFLKGEFPLHSIKYFEGYPWVDCVTYS